MKFSEILEKLNLANNHSLKSSSADDREITGPAPVDEAESGTIGYIEGAKFARHTATTNASALILPLDENLQAQCSDRNIAWIAAADPRLLFAQTIALFYQPFRPPSEIHPSAVVHPSAEIGENVSIGPHAVIQAKVKIGNNACIHPNVVIYPDAVIGENTVLHANCVIHERTRIGANCVIHSGAAIGSEGFGFV
ncbi:LpxD N-terminal domain-containing protein, partial [Microcoleus sp. herbarium8]|uniref:LpxD N-terminal domain-containing protein n=1 Tax=Microcoleus sp. herbarium8 TaxID=3055436 RepID=UPI002FD00BA8